MQYGKIKTVKVGDFREMRRILEIRSRIAILKYGNVSFPGDRMSNTSFPWLIISLFAEPRELLYRTSGAMLCLR